MQSPIRVVKPFGILDGTQANEFRQEIVHLLDNNIRVILIDFREVTFMDSSGLGALVLCLKKVRAVDGKLFICSINDQIRMLLELTSMDRVFEIFSSREELEQKIMSESL